MGRDRTADTRIFSPLLYRLSYRTLFLLFSFAWSSCSIPMKPFWFIGNSFFYHSFVAMKNHGRLSYRTLFLLFPSPYLATAPSDFSKWVAKIREFTLNPQQKSIKFLPDFSLQRTLIQHLSPIPRFQNLIPSTSHIHSKT